MIASAEELEEEEVEMIFFRTSPSFNIKRSNSNYICSLRRPRGEPLRNRVEHSFLYATIRIDVKLKKMYFVTLH